MLIGLPEALLQGPGTGPTKGLKALGVQSAVPEFPWTGSFVVPSRTNTGGSFERIGQLDRCAQSLRHELVASFFEKEDMSLEELEGRVGKVLKEALK